MYRETRDLKQMVLTRLGGALPKRSLGQNFLVSAQVIEKIIHSVENKLPKNIIEIGPGLGALTDPLINLGMRTVVELDHEFASYWKEQGLNVIESDALDVEWNKVCESRPTVVVSNLPYQISSRIVVDLSIQQTTVTHCVLMFQKEVAERIQAKPRTDAYGLLSVITQTFWKTAIVTNAGKGDFSPPPNVNSRVLEFEKLAIQLPQPNAYLNMVKQAFSQRRKLLAKNLSGMIAKEKTESWLVQKGFSLQARPEELSAAHYIDLYRDLGVR